MWNRIILLLVGSIAAFESSSPFLPYDEPLPLELVASDNSTWFEQIELKLFKRQNGNCRSGYGSCATIAAGGSLCCPTSARCVPDSAGNVACCPTQAACTGTIRPVSTGAAGSTPTGSGTIVVVGGAGSVASTTAGGFTQATDTSDGTTTGGIVFVGASATISNTDQTSGAGSISRSYVNNPYFPYAFIPTTYANAAACSSAYTTCSNDFASCSAYLAGAAGGNGVTVSVAGGGGTTVVATAAPTVYPSAVASSICASLSGQACYQLTVEACGNFGNGPVTAASGANAARCRLYWAAGVGAGVAIGVGI